MQSQQSHPQLTGAPPPRPFFLLLLRLTGGSYQPAWLRAEATAEIVILLQGSLQLLRPPRPWSLLLQDSDRSLGQEAFSKNRHLQHSVAEWVPLSMGHRTMKHSSGTFEIGTLMWRKLRRNSSRCNGGGKTFSPS